MTTRWEPLTADDIAPPSTQRVTQVGTTRVGQTGQAPAFRQGHGTRRQAPLARALRNVTARVGRAVMAAVFIAATSLGLLFGAPETKASALGFPDVACSIDGTFSNVGPEPRAAVSFIPADKYAPPAVNPDTAAPNGPWTAYERFGTRGVLLSRTTQLYAGSLLSDDDSKRSCSIQNAMGNALAQQVSDLNRFVAGAIIGIQQNATDSGPLLQIMQNTSGTVGKLRDQVFIPAMAIMVAVLGIWAVSVVAGPRDGLRRVIGVVLTSFGAAVVFTWLLMPTRQSNTAGATPVRVGADPNFYWAVASINDSRESAIGFLGSAVTGSQGSNDVCQLPQGAPGRAQRLVQCRLWESLVFQPWAQTMFGDKGLEPITGWSPTVKTKQLNGKDTTYTTTATKDLRIVLLAAQTFSNDGDFLLRGKPSNAAPPAQSPTPQADGERTVDPNKDQFALYYQTFYNLAPPDEDSKDKAAGGSVDAGRFGDFAMFRGTQPGMRLSNMIGATVASALVSVPVVVTSLLTMVWNAVPILLLLVLAFAGLAAMLPTSKKYAATIFQTWAKASILGFVFGVVQLIAAIIISAVLAMSNVPLGWKCVLMVVLILAMMRIVKAAQEDRFTPNFGGDQMLDPTNAVDRVREKTTQVTSRVASATSRRTAGVAVGAGAGVAGAAARGARAGKANRATQRQTLQDRRTRLDRKAAEVRSRKSGALRESAINDLVADRFVNETPKKARANMTAEERRSRLGDIREQEAARYDAAHAKDHKAAVTELAAEKERLEKESARPSMKRRVGNMGSAVRTGGEAAVRGAAAGFSAASRHHGVGNSVRAGAAGAAAGSTRTRRSGKAQSSNHQARRDAYAAQENARRQQRDSDDSSQRVKGSDGQRRNYADYDVSGKPKVGTRAERESIREELANMQRRDRDEAPSPGRR